MSFVFCLCFAALVTCIFLNEYMNNETGLGDMST